MATREITSMELNASNINGKSDITEVLSNQQDQHSRKKVESSAETGSRYEEIVNRVIDEPQRRERQIDAEYRDKEVEKKVYGNYVQQSKGEDRDEERSRDASRDEGQMENNQQHDEGKNRNEEQMRSSYQQNMSKAPTEQAGTQRRERVTEETDCKTSVQRELGGVTSEVKRRAETGKDGSDGGVTSGARRNEMGVINQARQTTETQQDNGRDNIHPMQEEGISNYQISSTKNQQTQKSSYTIFPPVQTPIYKYKLDFRYSMLIRLDAESEIPHDLRKLLKQKLPHGSSIMVDVDPYSFF